MRNEGPCPKCGGRRLFLIRRVEQTSCDAPTVLRRVQVTAGDVPTGGKTLFGAPETRVLAAEPCEAIVCAACGYLEQYASLAALGALERLAEAGVVSVLEREVNTTGAPFR